MGLLALGGRSYIDHPEVMYTTGKQSSLVLPPKLDIYLYQREIQRSTREDSRNTESCTPYQKHTGFNHPTNMCKCHSLLKKKHVATNANLTWGQRFCSIQEGGNPATMKSPSLAPQTSREAKTICPPKETQIIGPKKEKVQTKVLHVTCSGFPFKKAVNLEGEFLEALIIRR